MKNIFLFIIGMGGMFLVSCYDPATQKVEYKSASPTGKINEIRFDPTINSIDKIPLPKGYKRVEVPSHSFGGWLRNIPLKEINKIYLYNGQLKDNQAMHFAVMDISTGDKDLQQCADALMRLRAEYLFSKNAFDQINFVTGNGMPFRFTEFAMGERFALRGAATSKVLYIHRSFVLHASLPHQISQHSFCLLQYVFVGNAIEPIVINSGNSAWRYVG